jgi:hypothetical protein
MIYELKRIENMVDKKGNASYTIHTGYKNVYTLEKGWAAWKRSPAA